MYTGVLNEEQTSVKPLVIDIESGEVFNDQHPLNEIFNCVKFWNNKGLECHRSNNENYKTGGSYEDFILKCIAADCRAFVNAKGSSFCPSPKDGEFSTGQGGNHVWVHRNEGNKRILFIHF